MIDLYKESLQLHLDAVKNLADFDMETAITDYVRAVKMAKKNLKLNGIAMLLNLTTIPFASKSFSETKLKATTKQFRNTTKSAHKKSRSKKAARKIITKIFYTGRRICQ